MAGDSITVGVGTDNTTVDGDPVIFRERGYVGQARQHIARRYGDPGEGFIGSKDYGFGAVPSRRSYAGGGSTDVGQGPYLNGSRLNNASQTATFTTVSTGTIIKFWVWTGGTGTGATFAVDGGSNTATYTDPADGVVKTTAANTIPTAGTNNPNASTWTEYTISGLADTSHTIVFTGPTSGSGALRLGDIAILKQPNGVHLHRLGWSDATTANLVGQDSALNASTLGGPRSMTALTKQFGTKLLVLAFGANDYIKQGSRAVTEQQPGTTPTQYAANLKTCSDIAIANGACVLLVAGPRRPTGVTPETWAESEYYDAAKAIARSNDHYAFLDMAQVIGGRDTAYEMGYMTNTSVHPLRPGHGRIGLTLAQVIVDPMGVEAPAF